MQPPKNAFLSAKGLWRTELLVNIKYIKILNGIIKLYLMEPFNGQGYGSDYSSFVVIIFSFSPCCTSNIIVLCQSHK